MQQLNLFIKDLNHKKETSISAIHKKEHNIISRYRQVTECIFDLIVQLKSYILNYPFQDINEEIHFFKVIKPDLLSEFIYNNKVLQILIKRPPGNSVILQEYYEKELKELTYFFNANIDFYQYYRLNDTFYDSLYYVRNKGNLFQLHDSLIYNFEPAFSSSHDYLVAQIQANDCLEVFLKNEIDSILYQNNFPHVDDMGNSTNLQWTESKTALTELIYALCASGSINYGNCKIRELTESFEKIFDIQLADMHRTYQDIKSRNTPAKYIEKLQSALMNRINDEFL